MTKFLHFLMPETFAIYDSQAAASIESWRSSAFDFRNRDDLLASFRYTVGALRNTSGSGYRGVLDFYHSVWQTSSTELRTDAQEAAQAIERVIRSHRGSELARFTVLDLIDKYLWKAQVPPGGCQSPLAI